MFQQIPGHIRANTFWLAIIVATAAFAKTDRVSAFVGVMIIYAGSYLSEQATHLAQENHQGLPPTWIERFQQRHRWWSVILGFAVATFGAWITF